MLVRRKKEKIRLVAKNIIYYYTLLTVIATRAKQGAEAFSSPAGINVFYVLNWEKLL